MRSARLGLALGALTAFCAASALAHPHQFVDVAAQLVLSAPGELAAIRASFAMDETESLYIASHYGLDPDGPLTPEQSRTVFEAYVAGYEQFNWFTHLSQRGAPQPIGFPKEGAARMRDGTLTIEWLLPMETPVDIDAAPIVLQFYDPTFYAEAIVPAAPTATGPGAQACEIVFAPYVPTPESKRLRGALALLPPEATPEDPTVGRLFADRTEARCGDGSGEG